MKFTNVEGWNPCSVNVYYVIKARLSLIEMLCIFPIVSFCNNLKAQTIIILLLHIFKFLAD